MDRHLRVLQSFPEPRATTNPYIVMLRRSLEEQPGLQVLTFTWKRALLGRFDVFHVHWPEILISGRTPVRAWLRRVLFLALLLRLRVTGRPLVRTVHNLRPQERLSRSAAALLGVVERRTALLVRLNDRTPVPPGTACVTIPHGHYRDWFAPVPRMPRQASRLAFVGLIRPYKNVEHLLRVFRETAGRPGDLHLEIAGNPTAGSSVEALHAAADGDPRISLTLDFLPDDRLVAVVSQAELVVLPYREMHNSGAALMALSLDRPVLVPDNEVNAELAAEVGSEWVLRYDGELTADRLLTALEEARRLPEGTRPDLAGREWTRTGADHVAAYHQALAGRGDSAR